MRLTNDWLRQKRKRFLEREALLRKEGEAAKKQRLVKEEKQIKCYPKALHAFLLDNIVDIVVSYLYFEPGATVVTRHVEFEQRDVQAILTAEPNAMGPLENSWEFAVVWGWKQDPLYITGWACCLFPLRKDRYHRYDQTRVSPDHREYDDLWADGPPDPDATSSVQWQWYAGSAMDEWERYDSSVDYEVTPVLNLPQ